MVPGNVANQSARLTRYLTLVTIAIARFPWLLAGLGVDRVDALPGPEIGRRRGVGRQLKHEKAIGFALDVQHDDAARGAEIEVDDPCSTGLPSSVAVPVSVENI
jgi:hypothetical protein